MKIVHLCLGSFFPDNYSYQENMLPKFHKQLGYDVEVIASLASFDENGNYIYLKNSCSYLNEHNIKVTRLNYRKPTLLNHKLKMYQGTYNALKKSNPDILFIHGCQFLDMIEVVKYVKDNKNLKVYIDNHADYSNSARNILSKYILHCLFWRYTANLIEPYANKFYGVLPARVDFLQELYKIPSEKCELLVMGADDDLVLKASVPKVRELFREKYNISENDFLIVTGGKIDSFKKQTILLMQAVNEIKNKNVKLIVFGSIEEGLKEQVFNLSDGVKIQYIGWMNSSHSYNIFASADLVVFAGRHSVFWEQVAAQGIPMLCKYWNGTTHIDIGGNVEFLYNDSCNEIKDKILDLLNNKEKYDKMKNIAQSRGMKIFSYKNIAKKAIEID